ncbi:hypothetical protein, partial [Candidatus Entotheonella palauensis]|uniref:hypothetical protein n=1 Tax=Candidatus Entotheonella palauensis TaxID=93172 RepID=UPI001C4E1EC0
FRESEIMMLAEAPVVTDSSNVLDQQPQQTTLYDLIATMHDVAPDSEDLITATVMDMLRTRRIRFLGDPDQLSEMIASAEAM